MSPQLETQGPGEQRVQESGSGGWGWGGQWGLAGWLSFLGHEELHPGDRQPESRVTSVMRNIPKQEFCLLQNHCSLCDPGWLM